MFKIIHVVELYLICACLQFCMLSYSYATELNNPVNGKGGTDIRDDASIRAGSYNCYTTADQIRKSLDCKYGGVNSQYYLSPEEIYDLEHTADKGNGDAAFRIFQYYEMVVFDSHKGFIWLKKAAENGHVTAQYNLGMTISEYPEYGSKEDGLYWITKAADAGHPYARIELRRKFSKEEIDKLSRESEAGNANSALTLFFYYRKVVKDNNHADYWYKRWQDTTHKQTQ